MKFECQSPSGMYKVLPEGKHHFIVDFKNDHLHSTTEQMTGFLDAVKLAVELIERDCRLFGKEAVKLVSKLQKDNPPHGEKKTK